MSAVSLTVNGRSQQLTLDTRTTLLDALREQLDLTGSKKGCNHGQCGACTVLVDGRRVNSCLTFAASVSGSKITTIDGLASGEMLSPVQNDFLEHDGFQAVISPLVKSVPQQHCLKKRKRANSARFCGPAVSLRVPSLATTRFGNA